MSVSSRVEDAGHEYPCSPQGSAKVETTPVVVLESVLTCPQCGFAWQQAMPTDVCQFYQECPSCHALLRPKPGDCCVFCS